MSFNLRTIKHNGATYIRRDDVVSFLKAIGETEETDVRNRLLQAASNVEVLGQNCLTCGDPATRICDVRKGGYTCGLPLCSECVHEDACWKGVGAKTTKKNGKERT